MTVTTISAAKLSLAIYSVVSPTISQIPEMLVKHVCQPHRVTSLAPTVLTALTNVTTSASNDDSYLNAEVVRSTTASEKIIGEIRQWSLVEANWDGEGASPPSSQSIKGAVSFIKLISENAVLLEPMLLASGNAGLYLNESSLYVDIEFLSDERISYFIKRNGDKHKGVLTFDNEKMPAVFQTLIWS